MKRALLVKRPLFVTSVALILLGGVLGPLPISDPVLAAEQADGEQSDSETIRKLIDSGDDLREHDKLDQALADFNQALTLLEKANPVAKMAYLLPAFFGRAQVYAAQGKTELARADFKRVTANRFTALKTYVDTYGKFEAEIRQKTEAQIKLALEKGNKQDFDGTKEALDTCLQIDPSAYPCYVYRARLFMNVRQLPNALADLNRALELTPKEPQLYYLRAMVYANTDHRDLAVADLQKALELKPDFKEAADGLKQLGVTP